MAMMGKMEQPEIVRRQDQQRAAQPRDRIVERTAGKGGAMNALVQCAEEEDEHDAVEEQCHGEPRVPATRRHQGARRREEREMGAKLQRAARIRAPRQPSDRLTRQKRSR
jgi:hypothetical protein